jgi:predicted house-cleaning noncanonical NTP pyrophosphatase (MazG superfamily)
MAPGDDKLVRDEIPAVIREHDEEPTVRTVDGDEYSERRIEKLEAEVTEYRESRDVPELADLLERAAEWPTGSTGATAFLGESSLQPHMSARQSSMGGTGGITALVGYLLFLAGLAVALVATYLTLTP